MILIEKEHPCDFIKTNNKFHTNCLLTMPYVELKKKKNIDSVKKIQFFLITKKT